MIFTCFLLVGSLWFLKNIPVQEWTWEQRGTGMIILAVIAYDGNYSICSCDCDCNRNSQFCCVFVFVCACACLS